MDTAFHITSPPMQLAKHHRDVKEEFLQLPMITEVLRHELAKVFEPANRGNEVKVSEILPAQREDAYKFFSMLPPHLRMEQLIDDVLELPKCSNKVIVHALILLDRTQEHDPRLSVSSYTVVRLISAAITIARKATGKYKAGDNFHIWTKFWGPPEGIMGRVELAMLNVLNCQVSVTKEQYDERLGIAIKRMVSPEN